MDVEEPIHGAKEERIVKWLFEELEMCVVCYPRFPGWLGL
jgi:hypothetical protein